MPLTTYSVAPVLSFRHHGLRSLSLQWLHTFTIIQIWYIHHMIMHVKIEFGHGLMIFCQSYPF
jgi:hypothetical protein